jgi:hypothetical protein
MKTTTIALAISAAALTGCATAPTSVEDFDANVRQIHSNMEQSWSAVNKATIVMVNSEYDYKYITCGDGAVLFTNLEKHQLSSYMVSMVVYDGPKIGKGAELPYNLTARGKMFENYFSWFCVPAEAGDTPTYY